MEKNKLLQLIKKIQDENAPPEEKLEFLQELNVAAKEYESLLRLSIEKIKKDRQ